MTARREMVAAWSSAIGTLAVADLVLNRRHDGSTLSEVARHVYRTDTPAGRVAFVASWCALSAWLIPHICRHKTARGGTP